MVAFPIMLFTYKRFPLTNLTYTLIAIHAMILMLGGHYSYAKVPLGFWMEDWFGWTHNNYNKIAHFMQGFGAANGYGLYLSVYLYLFQQYTKLLNGWLPSPIRPTLKPFLGHRVTSGTRKTICFGVL